MSAVISISAGRRYGVARVCRAWGVSRSSLYRGRTPSPPSAPRRRPGPQGPMPDAGIVEAIRQTLAGSPFHGTLEQGQVAVFVAVDHASAECVGIHAALHGTRHEALEPIRQGAAERFGTVDKDAARGLAIRHDHGSQYMPIDFQREIAWLGATSSPTCVRQRLCAPPKAAVPHAAPGRRGEACGGRERGRDSRIAASRRSLSQVGRCRAAVRRWRRLRASGLDPGSVARE
jgi:hypothetical protein